MTIFDEISAFIFRYDQGALANLSCSITAQTPGETVIAGTKGRIKIHHPFWHSTTATISRPDKPDEIIEIHWIALDEAMTMAAEGQIIDAKTVVGLFRAYRKLSGAADNKLRF